MAVIVAGMLCSGDHVRMCATQARPTDWRSSGPAHTRVKTVTNPTISPHGYTNSCAVGATKSFADPTRSLAMTGQPQHMASFTTTPKGSYSEGRTITSTDL